MSALLSASSADREPRNSSHRRLSKRVVHAIDLLIMGDARTIQDAAKKAGMSREGLSKAFGKVHVQEFRKRRLEQTRELLDALSMGTLVHLLQTAESERVRMEIALKIQARTFAPDGSPAVNINIAPGYVIDLSGGRVTPHHETIEANALETLADVGASDVQREETGPADEAEHEPGTD